MKKAITTNEYLKLQGLLALMEKQNMMMKECEIAAGELVGDDNSNGWSEKISDFIYGEGKFDALVFCKKHKIHIISK